MTDFRTVGHLFPYLPYGVEHARLAMKDKAVGIGDVRLHLLGYSAERKNGRVYASILYGVIAGDDIRRHVAADAAASLYHGATAYARSCIGDNVRREYHRVINRAIAGYLRAVTEHALVGNLGVVRYMNTLHEEVLVAYDGLSAAVRRAVDYHVFTDDIVVADYQYRSVALVVEILRLGAEHGVLVYLVATPHAGAVHYADVRVDNAVVANLNVAFDISERINRNVLPYLRFRVYFCFWTYHIV